MPKTVPLNRYLERQITNGLRGYDHIHFSVINGDGKDKEAGTLDQAKGPNDGHYVLLGRNARGVHDILWGPTEPERYRMLVEEAAKKGAIANEQASIRNLLKGLRIPVQAENQESLPVKEGDHYLVFSGKEALRTGVISYRDRRTGKPVAVTSMAMSLRDAQRGAIAKDGYVVGTGQDVISILRSPDPRYAGEPYLSEDPFAGLPIDKHTLRASDLAPTKPGSPFARPTEQPELKP